MKSRKLFGFLLLCMLCILTIGAVSVSAASKKIKLKATTTEATHNYVNIDIFFSGKDTDIEKIEYKKGKTTKTADKYWKKATPVTYFYYSDNSKKTESYFMVEENGNYSVRVVLKSGKKYVKTIKIKNILPKTERSNYDAAITEISDPDSKGDYTITVNYYSMLTLDPKEVLDKKPGDIIEVGNRGKAKILEIYTMDSSYYYTEKQDEVVPESCVILLPEDPKTFYNITSEDQDTYYAYNDYKFGLIQNNSWNNFVACIAYDEPEEYREEMYDTVYKDVKLKVNKDTVIRPAYYDHEKYGYNGLEINIEKFLKLRNSLDLQQKEKIYITSSTFSCWIYEAYDNETGKFTDYVSEISEIYSP